jgi:hypothetical protein
MEALKLTLDKRREREKHREHRERGEKDPNCQRCRSKLNKSKQFNSTIKSSDNEKYHRKQRSTTSSIGSKCKHGKNRSSYHDSQRENTNHSGKNKRVSKSSNTIFGGGSCDKDYPVFNAKLKNLRGDIDHLKGEKPKR